MNSDYLYDMAETCFGTAWTGSTLKIDPLLIKVLMHYNVEIGNTIVGHDADLKTFSAITHLKCNGIELCVMHDNTDESFVNGYFESYHDYDKILTEIGGVLAYTSAHLYMFYLEGFDLESHVLKGE